jgi:hypothetical protein
MKRNVITCLRLALLGSASIVAPATAPAEPLAIFSFNEAGAWVYDGSGLAANLVMGVNLYDGVNNITSSDYHSASGTGVSGLAGDRAMNGALWTYSGSTYAFLENPQGLAPYKVLTKFSIAGWVNLRSIPTSSQRMWDWSGTRELQVWAPNSGGLRFSIGASHFDSAANLITSADLNRWVFIVITFDSTLSANAVKFYRGDAATAITTHFSQGGNGVTAGAIDNSATAGNFYLGNHANGTRGFPGSLDDISLHNTALTVAEIEALRLRSVNRQLGYW